MLHASTKAMHHAAARGRLALVPAGSDRRRRVIRARWDVQYDR
jgi:hypothetical protein